MTDRAIVHTGLVHTGLVHIGLVHTGLVYIGLYVTARHHLGLRCGIVGNNELERVWKEMSVD